MPNPNIIQFSLNSKDRELLEQIAKPNESLGLAAKRIITFFLKENFEIPEPEPEPEPVASLPEDLEDRLTDLSDRLEQLEKNQGLGRLSKLEEDMRKLYDWALNHYKGETAIMIEKKPRQRRAKDEKRLEA